MISREVCELMLATRDYVQKKGSVRRSELSPGIDSALTASIASDALVPQRAHVILMPSK